MDMEVETAENDRIAGISATISQAEDRPYEAILIDVQMPGCERARKPPNGFGVMAGTAR